MKKILISIILSILLFPTVSFAKSVAVVRGVYRLTFDNRTSPERSALVADGVFAALKETDGIEPISSDSACNDSRCLENAATDVAADIAVMVEVEEGAALYNFRVLTPDNTVAGEASGRFNDAVKQIADSTVEIVSAAIEAPAPVEPAATVDDSPPPTQTLSEPAPPPPPLPKVEKQRPSPSVWTCVSITAASAVTTGILWGVGASKANDYEDKDRQERTLSEKNQLDRLRVSTFAMIGVTSAAFTATGIAFFVSRHKRKINKRISLLPAATPTGGALFLRGSF